MQPTRDIHFTPGEEILAVALELASGAWKMALQDGKPCRRVGTLLCPRRMTISFRLACGNAE